MLNRNLEIIFGNQAKPEIEQELVLCKNCVDFAVNARCNSCDKHNLFEQRKEETVFQTQLNKEDGETVFEHSGKQGRGDGLPSTKCKWTEDTDFDGEQLWDTDCGETFVLTDGKPSDNNFKYCTFCGKEIEEVINP